MHYTKVIFGICLLIFFSFNHKTGEKHEWTSFRGFNGTGVDTQWTAPTSWEVSDYKWEIELGGTGVSSPVVWDESIFVTSSDDENGHGFLSAVSVGAGNLLWKYKFDISELAMHPNNKLASATPAVDALHVYVIWYAKDKTTLYAFTHQGSLQWTSEFGGIESRHGGGSSLVISETNVIFTREQEEGSSLKSSWVAVNKRTGETSWELERETSKSNSFSTPLFIERNEGGSVLICTSFAHGFTGVDPETGKVLWEKPGILEHRVVGSPVFSKGLLLSCYKGGGVVLELDSDSGSPTDSIVYALPRSIAPYVPSPIVVGDLLFLFADGGFVSCLNYATGELLWKEKPVGAIYGSPICVGGHLYCSTKDGKVIVIAADESYQLKGISELGEGSFSTPVMSKNGMIFRTFTKLKLL